MYLASILNSMKSMNLVSTSHVQVFFINVLLETFNLQNRILRIKTLPLVLIVNYTMDLAVNIIIIYSTLPIQHSSIYDKICICNVCPQRRWYPDIVKLINMIYFEPITKLYGINTLQWQPSTVEYIEYKFSIWRWVMSKGAMRHEWRK